MGQLDGAALAQRMNGAIDRALEEHRLVGVVVMIAQDGTVVFRRAAGFADRETGRATAEDTIFRLASLTKPVVTAAAMALVERGQLQLQDAVTRWLPDFRPRLPDGAEAIITVRQLMTHTAGLSYGFLQSSDGPYARARVSDGLAEPGLSMEEELRRLAAVPLVYVPGTSWGYSLALDVLGAVVSRAGGAPLPLLVEHLVTAPLGMADTAFAVHDRARLATPYVDGPRRMEDPDRVAFGEGSIRFSPSRIFDPDSYHSGGAGMAGTAPDFLRFLETLRQGGGAILRRDSTQAMMMNQIGALRIATEETPSWGFGFGGAVLMDPGLAGLPMAAGTWKWGGVYGNRWYVDPANRLTVVSLSNTAVEGMAGRFAGDLISEVYAAFRD